MHLSVDDIYIDRDVVKQHLADAFASMNVDQHDPTYAELHEAVTTAADRYAEVLWAPSVYELVRWGNMPNVALRFCSQLDPATYAAAYTAVADESEIEPRSVIEHCELLAQWCVEKAARNALEDVVCSEEYNASYH